MAPPADLKKALQSKGLSLSKFFTLKHGETRVVAPTQGEDAADKLPAWFEAGNLLLGTSCGQCAVLWQDGTWP